MALQNPTKRLREKPPMKSQGEERKTPRRNVTPTTSTPPLKQKEMKQKEKKEKKEEEMRRKGQEAKEEIEKRKRVIAKEPPVDLWEKGAPQPHQSPTATWAQIQQWPRERIMKTMIATADLEASKKQMRSTMIEFRNFLSSLPPQATPDSLPEAVAMWLSEVITTNKKVTRSSTIAQKARVLQSCMPDEKILSSRIVKRFLKGLARIQPLRPQALETASPAQSMTLMKMARKDPISWIAANMMCRGAARWADVRAWVGKKGRLVMNKKEETIVLELETRKTDQSGAAPMQHVIGPIKITEEEMKWLAQNPSIVSNNPLLQSKFQTVTDFLNEMQKLKKKAGIRNFVALRRGRARIAAERVQTKEVAKLLGHRPGSMSTRRYTRSLDLQEKTQRLRMTEL